MKKTYRAVNGYIYTITALTVLAGVGLFSQNYKTHADNSSVDRVSVTVPSSCTIGAGGQATGDTAHNATIISGEYKYDIGKTTIKAFCNDASGYVIYAVGASGGEEGQTDLISNYSDTYNIHTGTATSGATSAWAMKLTAGTGANPAVDGIGITPPTIAADASGSFANWHAVPNQYTTVAYRESQTEMNSDVTKSGSFLTTTYQVYANGSQPAGTYTAQVKYAMLHPSPNDPTNLVTLKMAFDNVYHETGQVQLEENGPSYYTMQSMTSAICNAANVMGEASQMQLIDTRDNSLYWVTKLQDGKCWMTQNLDLDLETTATNVAALTSANTDLKTYGSKGYDSSNGYACSNAATTTNCTAEGEVITWTPENATIAQDALNSTTWKNDYNNPYSYDAGEGTVKDGSNPYDGHFNTGNYYNWTAAIASNNSASFNYSSFGDINTNPQNSVCPKGWRLPTIANNDVFPGTVEGSVNEFRRLNVLYNGNLTNNGNALMQAPLYFNRSGGVNGGSVYYAGSSAYYWSSTVGNGDYAYRLGFISGSVNPEGNDYGRYFGFSVRCVAE